MDQREGAAEDAVVREHLETLLATFRAQHGMREKKGGPAVFHEGRAPSPSDVAVVAAQVETRMRRWLRRRGLVDERKAEDRSNEAPALSPMEACMQASLFSGELLRVEEKERPPEEPEAGEARFWAQKKSPWSAEVGGFNVHAGVTIRAGDRAGLEHLLRYAARGPVALSRLSRLADGRVGYRLRKPRKNGATHLVMTPVELLAKIASVVPPPKRPLLRLSGVLGPGSSWRASVVPHRGLRCAHGTPALPRSKPALPAGAATDKELPVLAGGSAPGPKPGALVPAVAAGKPALPAGADPGAGSHEKEKEPSPSPSPSTGLGSGVVPAQGARIDWASLLKRVFLE
jgi:hypothetical protein